MTSGANLTVTGTTGKIDLREAIAEFGSAATICIDDAPIYVMETEEDGSLTGNIYSGTTTVSGGVINIANIKLNGEVTTDSAAVMVDYYVDLPGKHVYEADITPDTFGGNYYVEADTLFRDQYTGKDLPANLTFPNVRLQSNFTMTFAGTGDPSTFDFTMDAFPGYTYFDKKKKVLAVLQVVDSIALGAGSAAGHAEDPVMYHDDVDQHAEAAARDTNVTAKEAGSEIDPTNGFTWKDGTTAAKDYTFINIGDAINFSDLVKAQDENGKEIDMATLVPVYTVTGNSAGYIDVDLADGYIVARKNVAKSAGCYVEASLTIPASGEGSSVTTKTLRLNIIVDDTTVAQG